MQIQVMPTDVTGNNAQYAYLERFLPQRIKETVSKMGVGSPSAWWLLNCARGRSNLFELADSLMSSKRRSLSFYQISAPNLPQFLLPGIVREVPNTEPAVLMPWLRQASPQPPSAPLHGLVCRVVSGDSIKIATNDPSVAGGQ